MADGRSSELRNKAISYDIYCSSCGKTKKGRDFYTSRQVEHDNEIYHKKYPICKKCIGNKIYRKDSGQLDKTEFIKMLEKLNLPFNNEVFLRALEDERETFGCYVSLLNTCYKSKMDLMHWDKSQIEEAKPELINDLSSIDKDELRIKKILGKYIFSDAI